MSETKKQPEDSPEVPSNNTEQRQETPVDLAMQNVRDKVTISTSEQTENELLSNYPDYQKILALYDHIKDDSGDLTIMQLRRKALNFCDEYFESYRKPFDIPDRLVALKVTCQDGDYYLSLVQGYLCFYKNPQSKHRIALKIVPRPQGYMKRPN